MTTLIRKSFKIPGKVVINGGYLVCLDEEAVALSVDSYLNVKYSYECTDFFKFYIEVDDKKEFLGFRGGLYTKNHVTENFYDKIVKAFFTLTSNVPEGTFVVKFAWDDGFFANESVKLGLGSSACIILALTKILYDSLQIKDISLLNLSKRINNQFSPLASGVDIASCLNGNIFYKKGLSTKLRTDGMVMLLGTMLRSSDTKERFHFLNDNEKWCDLREINKNINKLIKLGYFGNPELKDQYKKYLMELRKISGDIVPFYQYTVLMKTFALDIIGCGVSGSGGEDAVWCLVSEKSYREVFILWENRFKYVIRVNVPERSGLIEL